MFKVTLLPQKAGIRVWCNVFKRCEHEQTNQVSEFLNDYVTKLTGDVKSKIIMFVKEEVVLLRANDSHSGSAGMLPDDEVATDAWNVAGNLSLRLMKRQHEERPAVQGKVAALSQKKAARHFQQKSEEKLFGLPRNSDGDEV